MALHGRYSAEQVPADVLPSIIFRIIGTLKGPLYAAPSFTDCHYGPLPQTGSAFCSDVAARVDVDHL